MGCPRDIGFAGPGPGKPYQICDMTILARKFRQYRRMVRHASLVVLQNLVPAAQYPGQPIDYESMMPTNLSRTSLRRRIRSR